MVSVEPFMLSFEALVVSFEPHVVSCEPFMLSFEALVASFESF